MRQVHVDSVDLNLLKALSVLLEERHVSRAAARFHLSQSAMSRTLTRLRETFGDELLVRTGAGYELTPRARTIQRELLFIMPRLQSIVRGDDFDPDVATDRARLHCTDYITTVLGPSLFQRLFHQAPRMSLTIEPLSPHTFADVDRGRVDLALSPIKPPSPLRWQTLFDEDFVCLLSRDHPVTRDRLTLDDLASYPHASVIVMQAEKMVVEQRLGELGVHPPSSLRVPYFTAAVAALPGTVLIAILPRRFARLHAADEAVRTAEAPVEFGSFPYGMIWHPRLNTDPAQTWIRSLVQTASDTLTLDYAPGAYRL
jgi:DNA-binding transcriptional LysR family regulator